MSFRDKLLGTPAEREMKRLVKEVSAETEEVYGPLGKVGLAIVRAAQDSYRDLAPGSEVLTGGWVTGFGISGYLARLSRKMPTCGEIPTTL